jgi:L-histidine Nalpha-methyltransferase
MKTQAAVRKSGLEIRNYFKESSNEQLASDVLAGLTANEKYIPSKYFYDARGSSLFELICRLPEYYLTRTELFLLRRFAGALMKGFQNGDLVELGSGANWKIRILLEAMNSSSRSTIRYVPVDVSEPAIMSATSELMSIYPELTVAPVVADFTKDLHRIPADRRKLILFFGSTIGNLDEDEEKRFFRSLSKCLGPHDRFLLGLDMIKPVDVLEAAYNDRQNITAEFNKNMLLVLNKELSANFEPADFEHVAFFDDEKERVEMHLRAKRRVSVGLRGVVKSIVIERGETIRTEICRKFRREGVETVAEESGLRVSRWFSDPRNWFSIAEIVSS